MIKTSNKAESLGVMQKYYIFFVKREMPIIVSVNCEKTDLLQTISVYVVTIYES